MCFGKSSKKKYEKDALAKKDFQLCLKKCIINLFRPENRGADS